MIDIIPIILVVLLLILGIVFGVLLFKYQNGQEKLIIEKEKANIDSNSSNAFLFNTNDNYQKIAEDDLGKTQVLNINNIQEMKQINEIENIFKEDN